MKLGELEAKTILSKLKYSFDDDYQDEGKENNIPDLKCNNGRFVEVTHTDHNFGNIKSPNKFSTKSVDEQLKRGAIFKEAYDRFFIKGYSDRPKDKAQFIKDRKFLSQYVGLNDRESEYADIPCCRFSTDNIENKILQKSVLHTGKDIDLFLFVTYEEFDLLYEEIRKRINYCFIKNIQSSAFKNIFICTYDFKNLKHDINNYQMFIFNNLNNTFSYHKEGINNENNRNKNQN